MSDDTIKVMSKKERNTLLDRRGYVINKCDLSDKELADLKEELLVYPKKSGFGKSEPEPYPIYMENDTKISIPKFIGLKKYGEPLVDKTDMNLEKINVTYKGNLRPRQEIMVNKIIDGLKKGRGGMLIAGCGTGKTNMAIYIACKLKVKTLFLIHKSKLLEQIKDRIKDFTDCTEVGIIQQNKIKVDCPFVVGMIQSITSRDYPKEAFQGFGLLICDEAHHLAARKYSQTFFKCSFKYTLGITAETRRGDGLYKVVNYFLGDIIHEEEVPTNDKVIVKTLFFNSSNEKLTKYICFDGEENRPKMINNICKNPDRNMMIYNLVSVLFDLGKNILLLGGRVEQLQELCDKCNKDKFMKNSGGMYYGGMKSEDLDKSKNKQIVFATFDMAQEGFDVPDLNTVILLSPRGKINQSVGRIMRKDNYDYNPLVFDIVDVKPKCFKANYTGREKYYKSQQYQIFHYDIDDENNTYDEIQNIVNTNNEKNCVSKGITKPTVEEMIKSKKTIAVRNYFKK